MSTNITKPIPVLKDGEVTEWTVFEFQGRLVTPPTPNGLKIGTMEIEDGNPVLTVGYHKLIGKWVTLKKPLLILKRHRGQTERAASAQFSQALDGIDRQHSTHYGIAAAVRRKAVFSDRPVYGTMPPV